MKDSIQSRDKGIDILRGLAIVFVVLGHSGAPFTNVIYSFHVPLFFILSGFLRHRESTNIREFKECLKGKIKRLYIPYVKYNLLFLLLTNVFVYLHIYHTSEDMLLYPDLLGSPVDYIHGERLLRNILSTLLFCGGSQMGGALWFLRTMFVTSLIFEIENYVLKTFKRKQLIILLINGLLFCLGASLSKRHIHVYLNAESFFSIMIFYSVGSNIKNVIKFVTAQKVWVIIGVSSACLLMFCYSAKNLCVNIGKNEYSSAWGLLSCSITSFIVLYNLSQYLSMHKCLEFLVYIGRHTIEILALHFLCFKIVSCFLVVLYKESFIYISSYPYFMESYWWLYTIVGLIFPILLVLLKENIIKIWKTRV